MSLSNLKSKIQNIDACIAIIGLGYVGLPLSISFSKRGFKTIGFDIDEVKVQKLNSSTSYIQHISKDDISAMVNHGFTATTNFSEISNVDAIIICVPTPLGAHNEPDLSYIHRLKYRSLRAEDYSSRRNLFLTANAEKVRRNINVPTEY